MKNPKYKVHDWVKLHAMSLTASAMTYLVTGVYTETYEGGSQVSYRLRGHSGKGVASTTFLVAEMEIEAQIGTTIKDDNGKAKKT